MERVEKGVRSWIIDYPAMLSTWPAIEQRVDRPSSPCVAYFHYVRLCVKQGCERVVAPRRATMLSDAIYLRLHVSPHFPPFDFSFCRTRAPHIPLFFLSSPSWPYSKCFPSSLPSKPTLFFASKYPFPSSFSSFSRNKPTKYIHPQFLFRAMRQLSSFHPFPPFLLSLSLFLSFFFNKHAREKCRRSRGKISERIPLPLVREDESKEEKRNALLGDETA